MTTKEFDLFDLAAAIRATGVAQGDAAVALADDLMCRLESPTLLAQCESEIERRAALADLPRSDADAAGQEVEQVSATVGNVVSRPSSWWAGRTLYPQSRK